MGRIGDHEMLIEQSVDCRSSDGEMQGVRR